MLKLGEVLRGGADRMLVGNPADWLVSASSPRTLSTPGGSAYVKIAEGCNRTCSFCVIPDLRGKQRSRPVDDLVQRVADVPSIRWVRVFYLYPETITDELVELLAHHPRVVPYVDMPLQH